MTCFVAVCPCLFYVKWLIFDSLQYKFNIPTREKKSHLIYRCDSRGGWLVRMKAGFPRDCDARPVRTGIIFKTKDVEYQVKFRYG
jgi:hypothetical protein